MKGVDVWFALRAAAMDKPSIPELAKLNKTTLTVQIGWPGDGTQGAMHPIANAEDRHFSNS